MSQALDTQQPEPRSPLQQFRTEFSNESSLAELKAALPENVSIDKFRRALLTAVNEKPELVDVYLQNPGSLFSALTRCAAAGLLPDGKQAAINVYKTKTQTQQGDVWLPTAQFLPMIAGLRHVLAQYGWTMVTTVVYANDDFDYSEQPPEIRHRPLPPHAGERGDRIAAYAVTTHRDGRRVQTILWPADIAKRRAKAKTQKIWDEWTDEMWEKTVGHANFDDVPLDQSETERIRRLLADTDLGDDRIAALYGAPRPEMTAAVPATPGEAKESDGEPPQAATPSSPEGAAAPGFDYSLVGAHGDGTDGPPGPSASGDVSSLPAPTEDPGSTLCPDASPFAGLTITEACTAERVINRTDGTEQLINGRDWLLLILQQEAAKGDPFREAVAAAFGSGS